jgi:uroporphyrinogen decarboxylase
MNPRERVLQSMNFVQPDRVPIDFGAHRSSGIMAIAYARLRDYLGLPKRPLKVYDIPQQLAVLDEDILDLFHIDTIEMGRGFCQTDSEWVPWVLPDGTECLIPTWVNPVRNEEGHWIVSGPDGTPIAIQKKGILYFESIHWPLEANPHDLDRLAEAIGYTMWASAPMASPPGPVSAVTPEGARYLAAGAKKLRESTDRAIVGLFGGNLFELGQWLFGMEGFYVLLAGEPDLVHEYLDRLTAMHIRNLEAYLNAVGPYIDIIAFGDDYGMQTGPQISPKMYKEFFKPRHRRMWQRAKEMAPVKVMLHSCGSFPEFLDDMIEAGLDAFNPVQISSANMEPERLEEQFGGRITFWGGGCDTQQVIRSGSPEEIREHTLRNMEVFSPGGGFVFQQVHNIMADIPPENVVAMFNAVAEFNGTEQVSV